MSKKKSLICPKCNKDLLKVGITIISTVIDKFFLEWNEEGAFFEENIPEKYWPNPFDEWCEYQCDKCRTNVSEVVKETGVAW